MTRASPELATSCEKTSPFSVTTSAIPSAPTESSIIRATTRALLAPRRLIPILFVCIPLVAAQGTYSEDRLAVPLGIAMCAVFVLVAPVSWRVLFPEGFDFSHGAVRVVLYATISAGVVLTLGAVIPKILDMGNTFLTARSSLVVCAAMFFIGGWFLARDIGFEVSLARERARSLILEREAERSQLLALRSHLDPHFLFNTLNAIAEWCREDGETAERAVLELSAMLRAILSAVRLETWPIATELGLLRTLFSLHLLRDPSLFKLCEHVPTELPDIPVPPMILLPLAENAVKHGPASGHRGEIRLLLELGPSSLRVVLTNPGRYLGPRDGSDGIPTVEKRLELAYDGTARLSIGNVDKATVAETVVELSLPLTGPVTRA